MLPAYEILKMATVNAARAIGHAGELGVDKEGAGGFHSDRCGEALNASLEDFNGSPVIASNLRLHFQDCLGLQ